MSINKGSKAVSMDRFARMVINHRKAIVAIFIVVALLCAPLALLVKINYNIVDYLPSSSQSTQALTTMSNEFDEPIPNLQVMMHEITIPQALEYKEAFEELDGVTSVLWLDDVVDLKQPLEMADAQTVENYYKRDSSATDAAPTPATAPEAPDASPTPATPTPAAASAFTGTALFDLAVKQGAEQGVMEALYAIVGPNDAVGGEASSLAAVQTAAVSEVLGAFAILIPAILIILVLSTSSWLEPLLLLVSIGIAMLMNMGTNIVYQDVSFITNAVSPILQMAVSLDYAIFLLHSFADYRKQYSDVNVAMRHAMRTSFSTVASSASTTLFGFLALVFMQFLIGADLGISLVKGIIFSFITATIFLPALTLAVWRLHDRTHHRPLLPNFANIHRVLSKVAIPVTLAVIVAVVPSFLGQSRTDFLYGAESGGGGTRSQFDTEKIEQEFGTNNLIVALVPRGDVAREQLLAQHLDELPFVTEVVSYARTVGATLPPEFLGTSITNQFYSPNYARLLVYTDVPAEGERTFAAIGEMHDVARGLYGDEAYLLGRSANLYDMKNVVQQDNMRVNLIAIISIFLVLLFTFRSLVLPFLLLLTIESAIWINLAIPYFTDTPINYIGYLVLNTIQLGATVDYAILLTNTYLRLRKKQPKREAIRQALGTSFKSIIVSASVLTLAGFALMNTSTNPIVCDIGTMLGRGTLLSFLLVVAFLPLLLTLFDPLIGRLTLKADFLKVPKNRKGRTALPPPDPSSVLTPEASTAASPPSEGTSS
ncbi:MAG: MMPL family transporter [Coriobacteriales bacterium]|jgi:predicted RND superfamily exporter protein|nr:MMPL family transporter [Coriobacteriales bacterium]